MKNININNNNDDDYGSLIRELNKRCDWTDNLIQFFESNKFESEINSFSNQENIQFFVRERGRWSFTFFRY